MVFFVKRIKSFWITSFKKRMTLRIVFASVTLLKSVKYGEVYKSKN